MTTEISPFLAPQFPIARAALTPKRLERFDEGLSWLNLAIDAGWIANPIFTELKSRFRTALADSWQAHVSSLVHAERGSPAQDLWFSIQSDALHLLASTRKKIKASGLDGPVIEAMLDVVNEFDRLGKVMDTMKANVRKREVKTDEEREAEARFVPTPATPAATRKVYEVLTGITERNYDSIVAAFGGEYTTLLNEYMAADPNKRRSFICKPNYRTAVYAGVKEKRTQREPDQLRDDWQARIVALAEREASHLRDSFIYKVLRKLAPIIEAKGGLRSVRELGESIRVARLSGTLMVEFDDGSSFLADNNVVYSHSPRGTRFARFPLTFHRVVMPDGSTMKSPSEERMHTVFAGVPADDVGHDDDEPDSEQGTTDVARP